MKTTKTFENASLVSVVNGSIVVKSAAGIEHNFINASVVSINNGTIIIESEWKPKNGELVKAIGCNIDSYIIFQCKDNMFLYAHGSKGLCGTFVDLRPSTWLYNEQLKIFPVTLEEQQAFDDFCKSKGKIWNKEKLQWEEYKWSPKSNECYWYIASWGDIMYRRHKSLGIDQRLLQLNNAFQTKEEAEAKLKQIKEILNSTI